MTTVLCEDIPHMMWAVVTTGNGAYDMSGFRSEVQYSLTTQQWLAVSQIEL